MYANVEVKPELCLGAADPLLESSLYYTNMVIDYGKKYPGMVFPCFHIYCAGKLRHAHLEPKLYYKITWNP
jgi:hypothetical protein